LDDSTQRSFVASFQPQTSDGVTILKIRRLGDLDVLLKGVKRLIDAGSRGFVFDLYDFECNNLSAGLLMQCWIQIGRQGGAVNWLQAGPWIQQIKISRPNNFETESEAVRDVQATLDRLNKQVEKL
jgi:hypothetical protein